MSSLENAVRGLSQALDSPPQRPLWRRLVRHRLSEVGHALSAERLHGADAWLASRELSLHRERSILLARLADLGPVVLEDEDLDRVRRELRGLVSALEHHRQRLNDLVYDNVSLELGGSE
jgi:hypothetical protein